MAILNLPECHFVVYSSKYDNFIVFSVPFNDEYTKNMILNVKQKYIQYMLHEICKRLNVSENTE
jgi:hypothetical protein